MYLPRSLFAAAILSAVAASAVPAQTGAAPAPAAISAPISNIRYDLTFNASTAKSRSLKVAMSFDVTPGGSAPVLLSLPDWAPGSYELTFYARWVSNFAATSGGKPLTWDKTSYDTWRIRPGGAKSVQVNFDFLADTLDNGIAWTKPDFLFFNGTSLLLYPTGRGFAFPATVRVHTEPDWQVATGMHPGGEPGSYTEKNYHDLVDMPFFVGRLDYDSVQVAGRWVGLATYPTGMLAGEARAGVLSDIAKMIPVESAVFQDTPWDRYTTLMVFDSAYPGGSALEHQNSHLAIYTPQLIGNPVLASVTAHEIFHSWNVKRLRPAEMVPYRYDRALPTPWLWVSEGITDYYADLTLVRSGIVDSAAFFDQTVGKISRVADLPPTALEDASLSIWVHPTDGTQYVYYPKGSLAGFLLDIMIRDASDDQSSLDDVMRGLYRSTYKAGRGFTSADWWGAVTRAARGKSFTEFNAKYVDGREPYPWDQVLPLAGLRLITDTIREARLGLQTAPDSSGVHVVAVVPGGAAATAGVQAGDILLSLGEVEVTEDDFGPAYRKAYNSRGGADLPIVVRRGSQQITLPGKVELVTRANNRIEVDPSASAKAMRIREGLLHGR
ncbi:MAG: PDZ domain-containing protein [Gemmatimonadales bacterium]